MYRPSLTFAAATVLAATVLAAMAAPNIGSAQSFDCTKANTAVEKQICNDPNLGLMDTELSTVYGTLQQALRDQAKSTLRDSERAWLQQRDACDTTSNCVTRAYVQRLRELDQDYDVFTGWAADFESSAELQISITHENGRQYQIGVSGAGSDWTCDGTLEARRSQNGRALVVRQDGSDPVRIQAAGNGAWVPAGLAAIVGSKGLCGANAPSVSGFFARTSASADALPGFDRPPFIHPQIVQDMMTWLSDHGDQVVAINLTDSQRSNRYYGDFEVEPASSKGEAPTVSMSDGTEQFSYQFIGTMANGIRVLKTSQWSTDGTGVFPSLMFVSLRQDHGIEQSEDGTTIAAGPARTLLFKHGEIGLDDRWQGELKVDGNRIFVGANQSGRPYADEDFTGWITYQAGGTSAQ